MSWFGDLWSLEGAETRARVLDETTRTRLANALDEAREHWAAAETLFHHEQRARALAEAQLAFTTLAELELEGDVARVRDGAKMPIDLGVLPTLDRDVSDAHVASFSKMSKASLALDRALTPYAATPVAIRRLRLERRTAIVAVVVLLVCTAAWFVLANRWKPTASAHLPGRGPSKAIDGNVEEAWLLPAGTTGWLDLTAKRPKNISSIRICPPLGRVGAKKIEVAIYRAGAIVKTLPTELDDEGGVWPAWKTLDVHEPDVERVRVSVLTWTGAGGGLGDVQID